MTAINKRNGIIANLNILINEKIAGTSSTAYIDAIKYIAIRGASMLEADIFIGSSRQILFLGRVIDSA